MVQGFYMPSFYLSGMLPKVYLQFLCLCGVDVQLWRSFMRFW